MKEEVDDKLFKQELDAVHDNVKDGNLVKKAGTSNKKRKKRNHRKITRSQFLEVMHLSQKEAAEALDVCISTLKKQFSTLRPKIRWPTPNEQRARIQFLKLKDQLEYIIDENDMIKHSVPTACRDRWREWKLKTNGQTNVSQFMGDQPKKNHKSQAKDEMANKHFYNTIKETIKSIDVEESEVFELREHPEHSKREMQYMMKIAYYQKMRILEESRRSKSQSATRSNTPTPNPQLSTNYSNLLSIHRPNMINSMIQNHMRYNLQDQPNLFSPMNLIFQHWQQENLNLDQFNFLQPTTTNPDDWLHQEYTVNMDTMEIISSFSIYTHFTDLFSAQLFPTTYYSKIFKSMMNRGWTLIHWYDYQNNALVQVIVNLKNDGSNTLKVCIEPKCPRKIKHLRIGIDHSYHSFKPPRYKFDLIDQYFSFTDEKKVSLDYEWHHMSVFDTFEHKIKENFKVKSNYPQSMSKCPVNHTSMAQPQNAPSRVSLSPSGGQCPFHHQQGLPLNMTSPLQSLSPPPPSSSLSPNGSITSPLGILKW